MRGASPLVVIAVVPMLVLAVLVAGLIWISMQQGIIGTVAAHYTLDNYSSLILDSAFPPALLNTAIFALSTTTVALAIGLSIAWLVERTDLKAKTAVYALMSTGVLIPGIYVAMGWTFVAHPRIGFVNAWLQAAFGTATAPVLDMTSPTGMGFVQGLSLVPVTFILSVQTFRAMNPSLEEAARLHGLSLWSTLRRVTLPLALPGILAALIYILTIAIATFDIPAVLGMGNRVYVLSTYLYLKSQPLGAAPPDYGVTAALGTFMILVAVGLTVWYAQVLRHGHRFQVITGKGYRPALLPLHGYVWAAWALIAAYALLAELLPLCLIAFAAFTPYLVPPTPDALPLLGLTNFQRLDLGLVMRGVRNTLLLVAVVPLIVVALAFCTSWLVVRSRTRARYALEFGAFLPHALPEVILAVSALLVALFVVGRVVPLYGSVWLIAVVYVIGRLAFATRSFNAALLQIHRELEEAALVSGLSMLRTARRVLLPILRPTVFSIWAWTAVLVYRELTVAVFLVGQESITLPAAIWSFWAAGGRNQAAAVTLVMIAVVAPLLAVSWWFGRRGQVRLA